MIAGYLCVLIKTVIVQGGPFNIISDSQLGGRLNFMEWVFFTFSKKIIGLLPKNGVKAEGLLTVLFLYHRFDDFDILLQCINVYVEML